MPAFRSVWEPQQEAMKLALPLLLRKKQHEQELGIEKAKLKVATEKLAADAAEKQAKLIEDARKAQIKFLTQLHTNAVKEGDKSMASKTGPMLESLDMPVPKGPRPGPYREGLAPLDYMVGKPESELTGTAKNLEILLGRTPTLKDLKELKRAGKTEVNVGVDVGEKSMTELGKKMAADLVEERKDVVGAVTGLESLKEGKSLLESGMITGTGAEFLTNMGNFLTSRLGFSAFEDPVANTQAYAATMGNQVGQIIKQFGAGTGLSDADREYAEKIVGGKITLNKKALKRLLSINEKAFKNVIKRYNKKAEQAMSKAGSDSLPYDLRVEYDFNKPSRTELDKKADELIKNYGKRSKK